MTALKSAKKTVRKAVLAVPALRNVLARVSIHDAAPPESALKNNHVADLFNQGFSQIDGFLTEDDCEICVEFLRTLETKNPDAGYEYDRRFWIHDRIADKIPASMRNFMDSPLLKRIAESYLGKAVSNEVMLANIVRHNGANLGSGNGWHRDGTRPGVKAIVYLVDVTPENGALTIVRESFKKRDILSDSAAHGLNQFDVTLRGEGYNERIDTLLAKAPERRKSFTGRRGTCFLFETRGLHRGLPVQSGERYALTNYYEDALDAQVKLKRAAQGVLLDL